MTIWIGERNAIGMFVLLALLIFEAIHWWATVIKFSNYFTQCAHGLICCRSVNAQDVCHCIRRMKQRLIFLAILCRLLVQPLHCRFCSIEGCLQQ